MSSQNERINIIVKGRVQGVGFRYFIYEIGAHFKLTGWVKNKFNGNVEILAEGPKEYLVALLGEARSGPQSAHVININVEWPTQKNDLPPFTILPTD
jgi:acylphosphatase